MILADQSFENGFLDDAVKEVADEPVFVETLAIHAEYLRRPDRIRRTHVQEPAVQEVVFDLLAKLNLAADRVKRLQQERLDQPLRRDALATGLAVGTAESARHAGQHIVRPGLDRPKRMVRRNQRFEIKRMKDFTLAIDSSTHRMASMTGFDAIVRIKPSCDIPKLSSLAAC